MKPEIKNPMIGTYYRCEACTPEKYDVYIVKTKEETYEFALFDINGWSIIGDNKGATPDAWTVIPKCK